MFPYWNFGALNSTLISDTPSDIRSVVYPLSSHDSYEFLVTPTWSLAIEKKQISGFSQRTSREEAMGIHPVLAMLWAFGTRGPKGSNLS